MGGGRGRPQRLPPHRPGREGERDTPLEEVWSWRRRPAPAPPTHPGHASLAPPVMAPLTTAAGEVSTLLGPTRFGKLVGPTRFTRFFTRCGTAPSHPRPAPPRAHHLAVLLLLLLLPAAAAEEPPRAGEEVRLGPGAFAMGEARPGVGYPDEAPVREAAVGAFALDAAAATAAEFGAFVAAAGHTTDAEAFGDSFVPDWQMRWRQPAAEARLRRAVQGAPWWLPVPGAAWARPEGEGSDLVGREQHPAVHVSHRDAAAYCRWRGRRLPTEAEWEYAARGGLAGARYPWGDGGDEDLHRLANTFEGRFPEPAPEPRDGWRATAPARSFPPNAFGLFNMVGNTWEWTADRAAVGAAGEEPHYVLRGGSYNCHRSYCYRYRVSARTSASETSSASHYSVRCARTLEEGGAAGRAEL